MRLEAGGFWLLAPGFWMVDAGSKTGIGVNWPQRHRDTERVARGGGRRIEGGGWRMEGGKRVLTTKTRSTRKAKTGGGNFRI